MAIEKFAAISEADSASVNHEEALLLKKIASLKELLIDIGTNHQTHLLTYYILELATIFHRYYNQNRVIDEENIEKSRARLQVIILLNNTFKLCLTLLGVSCPDKM